jgi:hypothetical protein
VKRGTFGIILLVVGAARVYYENGMSSGSGASTNSVLQALDFGGSGAGGGISLFTTLILAGGGFALLAKPGFLTGRG